jgi:antitoxin (DNA-binding transcriptional repressor) of toxin-antitoxin stability system
MHLVLHLSHNHSVIGPVDALKSPSIALIAPCIFYPSRQYFCDQGSNPLQIFFNSYRTRPTAATRFGSNNGRTGPALRASYYDLPSLRRAVLQNLRSPFDMTHNMTHYIVMNRINIHEVKTNLSRYLRRLEPGETLTICRRNEPVAEIRALPKQTRRKRAIGLAKGSFLVPETFFEPLPDDLLDAFSGRK